MLGMKTYSQGYIDACRARVDAGVRAYRSSTGIEVTAGAVETIADVRSRMRLRVGQYLLAVPDCRADRALRDRALIRRTKWNDSADRRPLALSRARTHSRQHGTDRDKHEVALDHEVPGATASIMTNSSGVTGADAAARAHDAVATICL